MNFPLHMSVCVCLSMFNALYARVRVKKSAIQNAFSQKLSPCNNCLTNIGKNLTSIERLVGHTYSAYIPKRG